MGRGLSSGKKNGLDAVSDQRAAAAVLAMDLRGAMREPFGKATGIAAEDVAVERLLQYKQAVSRTSTPHASAILLLAAASERARDTGVLPVYEKTGYDKKAPRRLPSLLAHWSAKRLVKAGAGCVKLLLYHSGTSSQEINDQKHALVERGKAECMAEDVPFFLELVSYAERLDEGSAFRRTKPDIVAQGTHEFSRPQYRANFPKVGVLVNPAFDLVVTGRDQRNLSVRAGTCRRGWCTFQRRSLWPRNLERGCGRPGEARRKGLGAVA